MTITLFVPAWVPWIQTHCLNCAGRTWSTAGCAWSTDFRCTLRNDLTAGALFTHICHTLNKAVLSCSEGYWLCCQEACASHPNCTKQFPFSFPTLKIEYLSFLQSSVRYLGEQNECDCHSSGAESPLFSVFRNIYMRKMSLWDRSQMLTCASETVVHLDQKL